MRYTALTGPSATGLLPIGVNRGREFEEGRHRPHRRPNGRTDRGRASPVAAQGAKRWDKRRKALVVRTTTYTSTDRKTINKRYRKPCN